MLELTPDELLTTTRSARKRLDFEREVVEECMKLALQAPNGGNLNSWRWIAIDDPGLMRQIAEIYNGGLDDYIATFGEAGYPGARGLGSAWTTGHLWRAKELADLLGIPYDSYLQTGLFPVAYTMGTDFKAARRKPLEEVLVWNQFEIAG